MYFVQGILGLSRLGVSFLYKDEFGLDPASVGPSRMHHALHPCIACAVKLVCD